MVEVVFENFVNYLRSGNTDKLNIISFQQNQQHKINLSTQLIFDRILTKTVVQLNNAQIKTDSQYDMTHYFNSKVQAAKYYHEMIEILEYNRRQELLRSVVWTLINQQQ
ncbi:Hypothetical_protein [Hexamita inflata]|uniref:Hypothetical_protein n=1 Tax=Hexamita inflata TaxID=28002 RepID=A0AA86NII2_9EUKA|nr:Hypothetical protein HINF_LOCUS7582 [Hexamita inflata]CAI9946560.1 Hypothetical protein HINF_LOCUS34205 [Hexamita inflata]CAI9947669.1 Hypothetical protein HINF_LOCUS35314 [Hexamita inflata]